MEGWLVLCGMAAALSMDAFSMSLAAAMNQAKPIPRLKTAAVVGFFHMVMPCFGLFGGRWIAESFERAALMVGGVLLIITGMQMIGSAFRKDENGTMIVPRGPGIIFFAILVSLDSFSIGISLGILQTPWMEVLLLFGIFSAAFTWAGLALGGRLQYMLGHLGEAAGGIILFSLGVKLIL
ncbi:manganese efflux pump MntP [Salibacterium lacus]|uniref:Manganese efflux pump MntP family protein n=1 Tax=Salibacterium lacus TaxID=1898109 RepID=A0ABW5T697_9BACI